jgi:ferredoxin-NADP reductase/MOSC domain-containing protein YiiM
MELEHVCVGRIREHRINDQPVTTAYLKTPVAGPWRIGLDGLEGNEVAVHTDPVYAYARDAYEYWAARLNARAADWGPGTFAENLTFATLDEASLRIGDVLALGDEVRLVVAGPRVPCFKLTWRLKQPESFIREFALSGHTGVYFGVEQAGTVQPGDRLAVIRRAAGNPTVTEVAGMVFGDDMPDEPALEHVLEQPALSATVALALRARLYMCRDLVQTRAYRWRGWRRFVVDDVRLEAHGIRSLRLRASDGLPLARYRAGQFLTVRVPIEGSDELTRTWSCSDYSREPDRYRISVKLEPRGVASGWLHENVSPGLELDLRAPAGRFVLDRSGFKPVVLVAAGIGITPILAMLKAHLDRGRDAPRVYLVHCVRDGLHHAFRNEIRELAASHPGVTVHNVYSAPRAVDRPDEDFQQRGRFSAADLIALLHDSHLVHCGKRIDLPWFESDVYICGPAAFQDGLRDALIAAGARTDRIFTERFSIARGERSDASVAEADVRFEKSNVTARWSADEAPSLLELAEAAGLAPEAGCRMGICQSCQCRLVEGAVSYDSTPLDLPGRDRVLACIARPASARVVVEL